MITWDDAFAVLCLGVIAGYIVALVIEAITRRPRK